MSLSLTVPTLGEDRVDLLATVSAPPRFPHGTPGFSRLGYELLRALCIRVMGDPYLGPTLDRRELSLTRAKELVPEDAGDAVGLENVLDVAYDRYRLSRVDANHVAPLAVPPPNGPVERRRQRGRNLAHQSQRRRSNRILYLIIPVIRFSQSDAASDRIEVATGEHGGDTKAIDGGSKPSGVVGAELLDD